MPTAIALTRTHPPAPAPTTLTDNTAVSSVAFSPDGKLLTTGGKDGTVRLWDMASRETIATLTGD